MIKLCLVFLLFILFSCHTLKKDYQKSLNFLAVKTCKAITIRKQRFALADEIRFIQDTLATTKNSHKSVILKDKLSRLLKYKDKIIQQSLLLADTIRVKLDSMNSFYDKAEMKHFNSSLDSILTKKNCKG